MAAAKTTTKTSTVPKRSGRSTKALSLVETSVETPQSMDLDIEESITPRLLTRIIYRDQVYYTLFDRQAEGPFVVTDAPYRVPGSILSVGQITKNIEGQEPIVVGSIFHTKLKAKCTGSFLLAYTGAFQDQIQKRMRADLLTGMNLLVKTENMQIYGALNKAILVVSPFLRREILDVLEM